MTTNEKQGGPGSASPDPSQSCKSKIGVNGLGLVPKKKLDQSSAQQKKLIPINYSLQNLRV